MNKDKSTSDDFVKVLDDINKEEQINLIQLKELKI